MRPSTNSCLYVHVQKLYTLCGHLARSPQLPFIPSSDSINKLSFSRILKRASMLVMRDLFGKAKAEDAVMFFHIFAHTTLVWHDESRNLTSLLLVNNTEFKQAVESFGQMLTSITDKARFKQPLAIPRRRLKRAWENCTRLFRASATSYREFGDATVRYLFVMNRLSSLIKPGAAKLVSGTTIIEKKLENEWTNEILPGLEQQFEKQESYYARPWLPEDDTNPEPYSDQRAWLHQLMLDPTFYPKDPEGRCHPPTQRYQVVHKAVEELFWTQLGFEVHKQYTPRFTMIDEFLKVVYQRLGIMFQFQGLLFKPTETLLWLEERIRKRQFTYDDGNDTLVGEIATLLLEFHFYGGGKHFEPYPQQTRKARSNPTFGKKIFEKVSMLRLLHPQLHDRLKGLFKLMEEITCHDRRDVFRQTLSSESPSLLSGECKREHLDATTAWLLRARKNMPPNATAEAVVAKAVVELAANAPALLRVFPETFSEDKRDFLAFYNQMERFVDQMAGARLRASHPVRMAARQRLLTYMEARVLVRNGHKKIFQLEELVGDGFTLLMRRMCRVARLNWIMYRQAYQQIIMIIEQ